VTTLYTFAFRVSPLHYSLAVILSEENIRLIKNYDPAEVVLSTIKGELPWTYLMLKDVVIGYATGEELKTIDALLAEDKWRAALRLISRGYRFRPEEPEA
jgi:hypothetical protein